MEEESKVTCTNAEEGITCKYAIDIALMRDHQTEMREDIKQILVALKGNGKEGLCTRMKLVETEIQRTVKIPMWKKLTAIVGISTVISLFTIIWHDPACAPKFAGFIEVLLKILGA